MKVLMLVAALLIAAPGYVMADGSGSLSVAPHSMVMPHAMERSRWYKLRNWTSNVLSFDRRVALLGVRFQIGLNFADLFAVDQPDNHMGRTP